MHRQALPIHLHLAQQPLAQVRCALLGEQAQFHQFGQFWQFGSGRHARRGDRSASA
jgi:hypothetical protein